MTVGELRRVMEPMADEAEVVVFDGEGGSLPVQNAMIEFTVDGEGQVAIVPWPDGRVIP